VAGSRADVWTVSDAAVGWRPVRGRVGTAPTRCTVNLIMAPAGGHGHAEKARLEPIRAILNENGNGNGMPPAVENLAA